MTAPLDDAAERRIRELAKLITPMCMSGHLATPDVQAVVQRAWTEATEAAALKCDAIENRAGYGEYDCAVSEGARQCAAAIRGKGG